MTERHEPRRPEWRRNLTIILSLAGLAALMILAIVAGLLFPIPDVSPATSASFQMIDFTHQKHIAAGVPCLFCHPQARNGPVATIPSVQKCAGCHQNVQITDPNGQDTIARLLRAWKAQQALRWPRIVDLPDFVNFNHRPHIAAGKSCEQCHGNVSSMGMARMQYRINMGFCLNSCHRHQDPQKRERLMDCATCHK